MHSPTYSILQSSELVKQGAEAKVYKCLLHPSRSSCPNDERSPPPPEMVLLKHRFKKNYRHPALDTSLTKARIAGEARAILKCLRAGVSVPGIRMVDASEGIIGIEWIEGASVRSVLGGQDESEEENSEENNGMQFSDFGTTQSEVMTMIGEQIGKLHKADVIHGDLTTSNMMLRRSSRITLDGDIKTSQIVLIDFGLSYVSALIEDKAVDLYVLERAFASTHPDSEPLFALVLDSYARVLGKEWRPLSKKLEEVRLRGRKRSMVG